MYHVTVRQLSPRGKVVARKSFAFGSWMEIAYWLDDQAFISADYRVTILFEELED